jgi:Ca2+-dependent lipid-binding protein
MDCTSVTVVVKGARKLDVKYRFRAQNPYLRIWIASDRENKYRTQAYTNGRSLAVWNESYKFPNLSKKNDFIFMEVRNDNRFVLDDLIGRVKLHCSEIPNFNIGETWCKIYDNLGKASGEVHLSFVQNISSASFTAPPQYSLSAHTRIPPTSQPSAATINDESKASFIVQKSQSTLSRLSLIGYDPSVADFDLNNNNNHMTAVEMRIPQEPLNVTVSLPQYDLDTKSNMEKEFKYENDLCDNGWEIKYTVNNRVYYYNKKHNFTTWMRPELSSVEVQ